MRVRPLLPFVFLLACTASSSPPPSKDARDDADDVDAVALDVAEVAAPDASPEVSAPDASTPDASVEASVDVAPDASGEDAGVRCPTTFRFAPAVGARPPSRVEVTGEWTSWSNPGIAMRAGADGAWTVETDLPPGLLGYKFLVDGAWVSDDAARRRKYVGGVENPALLVDDCRLPRLSLVSHTVARAAAGAGTLRAEVSFAPGLTRDALDPATLRATLRRDGVDRALPAPTLDAMTGRARLDLAALADGKYTVLVEASDRGGRAAAPLRVVFWVEAERFDWQGAPIYMAMVDRFANGDRTNDARPTAGVDPRADYQGGDFQGLRARIADGTLDRLGVRALWIAPVNRNPDTAWLAANGRNRVMGYHGYWPVRAREVDPRLGGEAGLRALVAEAHAHSIRVLQDFVVNHVHREHEYFRAHPEWFRTGCVCGTGGCDWTGRRLDCLFTDYLPDVNWSVPEAVAQFADDAAFWVDRFDLDGLRVDAVKHVEDIAVYNLRARLADGFEATGLRVFLTGETAMGWSDCGLDCNRNEYATISRYLGPLALDGQADFVLYHAVPYRVFSADQRGMLHLDYWTLQSQRMYPAGAVMTPYIGSHDTPRFTTLASYRGQGPGLDPGVPNNQWDAIAEAPRTPDAYARHRLAMSWVLTIPGAPLLYYGDEYGEWGGADPNNRRLWRDPASLNADETATLAHVRALGSARRELEALRRGEYVSLDATEETLVFARRTGTRAAVVALSRASAPRTITVRLPGGFPVADGATLRDRLGGASVTVRSNALTVTLPAWGSAVLAE
jgi:glycosidase